MADTDLDFLKPDEAATIAEAEAEIARGERVPPEVIDAFWRAHGLSHDLTSRHN